MSFYDLTKENVLSANELFKYRLKRDGTVPSKGGQKAFEPDGSWMHSKALESFMQERTKILGEQRVEKLKSLVQGVWAQEKRLVNLSKPGKFWAHMGFTDKRRNWLYPEEALFLIETNTLEVYDNGLPLSIQEAYSKFIGPDLSLEEYQVFAHLRRLGYVVLRQEAQLEITPYEKQINLDKYMTKQNLKERKEKHLAKKKNLKPDNPNMSGEETEEQPSQLAQTSIAEETEGGKQGNAQDLTEVKDSSSCQEAGKILSDTVNEEEQGMGLGKNSATSVSKSHGKRSSPDDADLPEASREKKPKVSPHSEAEESLPKSDAVGSGSDDQSNSSWYTDKAWAECFKRSLLSRCSGQSEDGSNVHKENERYDGREDLPQSDSTQAFPFPTIANKTMLSLTQPWQKLLPPNVEVNEDYNDILVFDVEGYRREHPPREETKSVQREEEREARIRNLKFSFSEWTQRKPQIKASNWTEYKQCAREMLTNTSARTPVDHLWKGAVTPLVRPEDAITKQSILDRLNIVQSAENDTLLPNLDCLVDLKVSFCVHLPDSRFKKSMPGTPNHRVCVVKCSAEPPNLAEVQEVWSRFKDGVPLHCAVVDSGEIAFYIFDNTFKLDVLP